LDYVSIRVKGNHKYVVLTNKGNSILK